ncbi:hypothetical protein [Candidatus Hakubella thermalkaliphila]|nr:hypothetical protein [Candidatus Hakubella thermalkaliphila]
MFYAGGSLEGRATGAVNAVGHGRAVYAGLWPNEAVLNSLIGWLIMEDGRRLLEFKKAKEVH